MKFVSEAIAPQGEFVADGTANGEPAVPKRFLWGEQLLTVTGFDATRRGLKSDRGEMYLKRHYYDVRLDDGRIATIYCERHPKVGAPRWYLYTISSK